MATQEDNTRSPLFNLSGLPDELRRVHGWVVRTEGKVPVDADGRAVGAPELARMRLPLGKAIERMERLNVRAKGAERYGLGLTPVEVVMLDVDCYKVKLEPDDPAMVAWLEELGTYAEVSPSHKGVRVAWLGKLAEATSNTHTILPIGKHQVPTQIFCATKGYATITGWTIYGCGDIRQLDPDTAEWLCDAFEARPATKRAERALAAVPGSDLGDRVQLLDEDDRSAVLAGHVAGLFKRGANREDVYATLLSDPLAVQVAGEHWKKNPEGYLWTQHVEKLWGRYAQPEGYSLADEFDDHSGEPEGGTSSPSSSTSEAENPWLARLVRAHILVGEPPERSWVWRGWIPHGVVTGLAGPPGCGKSLLGLQLSIHQVLGMDLLGAPVAQGPALFITVEDDLDELWRRVHAILDVLEVAHDDPRLEGLALLSLTDIDTEVVHVDRDGQLTAGKAWPHFVGVCNHVRPRLVTLDLVGDFWNGNDNAKSEVTAYVRGHLGRMAARTGAGVLTIQHPSVASLRDGRGFGGALAWLGSYRSGLVMLPEEGRQGRVELSVVKANYAPPVSAELRLDEGYLVEVLADEQVDEARGELEAWLAALPFDEGWRGVDTWRAHWPGVGRAEARERLVAMDNAGYLDSRTHAGTTQYRRSFGGLLE